MRAKSGDDIIYDVIFSKIFLFAISVVINKAKFFTQMQCIKQFIYIYRILRLQVMMSPLNKTLFKFYIARYKQPNLNSLIILSQKQVV